MAARMKHEGCSNQEIVDAIHGRCGRAPDLKNITKLLRRWIEDLTATGDQG
jgi:hypothetical protein